MRTLRIARGFVSSAWLALAGCVGLATLPVMAASTSVSIVDFSFNPSSVTINVNDSVMWNWVGPTIHTTTSDTSLWDSGTMDSANTTFSHTFTSSGSFPYHCKVHPFMTASVTVQAANAPPTVSITSPTNGAVFTAPWSGTIMATSADSDGTVTRLQFLAGTTVLGTITNPPANASFAVNNLAAGSYTLKAVATDNGGASTTSAGVNITVQAPANVPPTVSITSPTNGAVFAAPWNGTIMATSADSDGTVTTLQFLAGTTVLGTITNPPANASFAVNNLAAGSYTLKAVATDNGGASTTSAGVNITVQTPANVPPTVSITSPTNGAVFAAPWSGTIMATSADSDGTVSTLQFLAGTTVLGTITNPPANASFAVTNLAAGSYTLKAVATDNGGASTTSAGVNITVQTQTNVPPTVSITSPTNGAVFTAPWSGTIMATSADSDGTVTTLQFLAGTTVLGTITNPPANASFAVTNLAAGSYTLKAVATDNGGASTTSSGINITVSAPGLVSISSVKRTSPTSLQFTYSATAGQNYLVERSADLKNWSVLATNMASSTSVTFTDTAATGAASFYRIKQSP